MNGYSYTQGTSEEFLVSSTVFDALKQIAIKDDHGYSKIACISLHQKIIKTYAELEKDVRLR